MVETFFNRCLAAKLGLWLELGIDWFTFQSTQTWVRGQHSTEASFALHTQRSWVRFVAPEFFSVVAEMDDGILLMEWAVKTLWQFIEPIQYWLVVSQYFKKVHKSYFCMYIKPLWQQKGQVFQEICQLKFCLHC